jgi:FixJ family two-component response regulator
MSRAKKVVAIVEDEHSVRRALERLLRAGGVASQGFASGDKFLRSLEARLPDCVILGHQKPGRPVLDLVARMAAADLQIPVLVLGRRAPRAVSARRH